LLGVLVSDPYALLFVTNWGAALENGRLVELLAMYDEDAVLVPTFSSEILKGHESLSVYFTSLMSYPNLEVGVHEEINQNCHEGHRAISGHYTFSWGADPENRTSKDARFTFAIEEEGSTWTIHAHHSSVNPGSE
jgi:hypothetical protein